VNWRVLQARHAVEGEEEGAGEQRQARHSTARWIGLGSRGCYGTLLWCDGAVDGAITVGWGGGRWDCMQLRDNRRGLQLVRCESCSVVRYEVASLIVATMKQ
jgi:hypothetical protein